MQAHLLYQVFQFTLPHRERPATSDSPYRASLYFNSRSRTGSDSIIKVQITTPLNFNSRSRTGSDRESTKIIPRITIFQFTLPHRERPAVLFICNFSAYISIHAPAQGATKAKFFFIIWPIISIHAPAQGATEHGRHESHAY